MIPPNCKLRLLLRQFGLIMLLSQQAKKDVENFRKVEMSVFLKSILTLFCLCFTCINEFNAHNSFVQGELLLFHFLCISKIENKEAKIICSRSQFWNEIECEPWSPNSGSLLPDFTFSTSILVFKKSNFESSEHGYWLFLKWYT